jgi:predicted NAD/FAD-dependent oxidoreductase
MWMKRYVIIGNGVAGARAAVKIREADKDLILKG